VLENQIPRRSLRQIHFAEGWQLFARLELRGGGALTGQRLFWIFGVGSLPMADTSLDLQQVNPEQLVT